MRLDNKITNILAGLLLVLMLGLALFSMQGDSATMDELAHIPAGYSYIAKQDMRLNPEHPPLLKDLAGLSVWLGAKITGQDIHFPEQHKSWQKDINGQWDFGGEFLYRSGNDADKIIFWARLPMLLIMVLLGFYVFLWTRQTFGNRAGLIAVFLYSLSPTFLAHGRYVTTDVGAAAAFFIATYYLVKWLKNQSIKNLIIAGIVLSLALLTKFSLALLIPYFIFLTLIWIIINRSTWLQKSKTIGGLCLIGLIAMALIWPVYQFHVWHYPVTKQKADTEFLLHSFGNRLMADPVVWLADKPVLRAYGQFFLGLLMVIQRAVGGNTTFFMGEVSAAGWPSYFPIVFLIKVPLALLILTLIGLLFAALQIKKPAYWSDSTFKQKLSLLRQWLQRHFDQFALFVLFVLYWTTTLRSNLNIGVRHILPTFPVIYVLISGQISQWLAISFGPVLEKFKLTSAGLKRTVRTILIILLKTYFKYVILVILLTWYALGTLKIYPHFLAYFNELVGGAKNGYHYVVDSNLDWGQDLKRLAHFVKQNNIRTIYVDYFGGGSVEYYLKNKYQPWWNEKAPNELPKNSWLAVSATFLQGGRGLPAPSFNEKTGYYRWLNQYEPVAVIGYSIFVYFIE